MGLIEPRGCAFRRPSRPHFHEGRGSLRWLRPTARPRMEAASAAFLSAGKVRDVSASEVLFLVLGSVEHADALRAIDEAVRAIDSVVK